jgi:hypothetical protein
MSHPREIGRIRQIFAPDTARADGPTLFVGGGITNCPDWQAEFLELLANQRFTALNPRRRDFNIDRIEESREQIEWEFGRLEEAAALSFWFPKETLCPITLYELGRASRAAKPLFVGVHPDYARRFDIEVQLGLARPEVPIVDTLPKLAAQVCAWAQTLENLEFNGETIRG